MLYYVDHSLMENYIFSRACYDCHMSCTFCWILFYSQFPICFLSYKHNQPPKAYFLLCKLTSIIWTSVCEPTLFWYYLLNKKIIFVHRWNLFHIFVILILSGCPCYFDLDPFIGCSLSTFTFPTSSWNHLWSYIRRCFSRVIFFSGLLMNLLYTFVLIYFMKIKRSLGCIDIRILYAVKTIYIQMQYSEVNYMFSDFNSIFM